MTPASVTSFAVAQVLADPTIPLNERADLARRVRNSNLKLLTENLLMAMIERRVYAAVINTLQHTES